jgi:hypothetical protein
MPPGRPRQQTDDLDLNVKNNTSTDRPKKTEPTRFTFELIGDFKKDPENGTIRYPPLIIVNNEDLLYDEDTKQTRQARVLRGVSSIWRDEQEKITESYAKNNRVMFEFHKGKLIVPAIEKNYIKYLMMRSDFVDCKVKARQVKARYRLVDTYSNETKALQIRMRQMEAVKLAMDTEIDDLIPHYKHLGGIMVNDYGDVLSDEGLRASYMKLAEEKPKLFIDTYNNPVIKMFGLVRTAFENNLITYVDGQCAWNDTKTFICQVPHDYKDRVADYLAELMLTKEGVEIRSRLENM